MVGMKIREPGRAGRWSAEMACMWWRSIAARSEEHTSELQSRLHLVCRLLLEKKKNNLESDTLVLILCSDEMAHDSGTLLMVMCDRRLYSRFLTFDTVKRALQARPYHSLAYIY